MYVRTDGSPAFSGRLSQDVDLKSDHKSQTFANNVAQTKDLVQLVKNNSG